MIIVLFIIGMVAILVVSLVLAYLKKQKLMEFAKANGLTFSEFDAFNVQMRCSGFKMFNRGRNRKVYNIIYGVHKGLSVCFFHYRYVTGSGKNRKTHHHNGLLVVANLSLPGTLSIRPENFFDKIAEVIGFDDIDFEYHEFNKKYYVKSDNKRMAYDFFGRDMMTFFLNLPRAICIEAMGPHFLFQYGRSGIPIKFYKRMLDTATSIFNHLDPLSKEKFGMSETMKNHFQNNVSDPLRNAEAAFGGVIPTKPFLGKKDTSNGFFGE